MAFLLPMPDRKFGASLSDLIVTITSGSCHMKLQDCPQQKCGSKHVAQYRQALHMQWGASSGEMQTIAGKHLSPQMVAS